MQTCFEQRNRANAMTLCAPHVRNKCMIENKRTVDKDKDCIAIVTTVWLVYIHSVSVGGTASQCTMQL